MRDHVGGLAAFMIALLLTTKAIESLQLVHPAPALGLEVAVLTAVNVIATAARFVILRTPLAKRSPVNGLTIFDLTAPSA